MAILTSLTALSISAVAIYYSTLGLAAIFAGAATAQHGYGVVLEVGKLVTVLVILQNWKVAPDLLKHIIRNCSCGIDVYYIQWVFLVFYQKHTLNKHH